MLGGDRMANNKGFENITLYDDGTHKFILLAWEEKEEEGIVQTNQYIILDGNEAVLLDPGGAHVFPRVLANVSEIVEPSKIKHIFFSHQDPDVTSGITLWMSIAENAKIYISTLWTRFLPHFGIYDQRKVVAIPSAIIWHRTRIHSNPLPSLNWKFHTLRPKGEDTLFRRLGNCHIQQRSEICLR